MKPLNMRPKDYRTPKGVFDKAICKDADCAGQCFYSEPAARQHAQLGHTMEITYVNTYIANVA